MAYAGLHRVGVTVPLQAVGISDFQRTYLTKHRSNFSSCWECSEVSGKTAGYVVESCEAHKNLIAPVAIEPTAGRIFYLLSEYFRHSSFWQEVVTGNNHGAIAIVLMSMEPEEMVVLKHALRQYSFEYYMGIGMQWLRYTPSQPTVESKSLLSILTKPFLVWSRL